MNLLRPWPNTHISPSPGKATRNPLDERPPAQGLGRGGGGTAAAGTLTESVVGMYVPTPADLALRAAAAGLVASVLGRVKEFTTLFAQVKVTDGSTTFIHSTAYVVCAFF